MEGLGQVKACLFIDKNLGEIIAEGDRFDLQSQRFCLAVNPDELQAVPFQQVLPVQAVEQVEAADADVTVERGLQGFGTGLDRAFQPCIEIAVGEHQVRLFGNVWGKGCQGNFFEAGVHFDR